MEEIPNCNYYGNLKGELLGENASIFAVDVAFNGLLERYEKRLEENQAKMITNLKATFAKNFKEFKDSIKGIYLKINKSEKESTQAISDIHKELKVIKDVKLKGRNTNAISERNESVK